MSASLSFVQLPQAWDRRAQGCWGHQQEAGVGGGCAGVVEQNVCPCYLLLEESGVIGKIAGWW